MAILDQMEAEHGELLEILTTVDTGFKTLSDATDKVVLNDQLEALFTVLSQHCEHEETQGIQVVQRYITQEDMKEFMKFNREGEHANFVLPWICDGAQPSGLVAGVGHDSRTRQAVPQTNDDAQVRRLLKGVRNLVREPTLTY